MNTLDYELMTGETSVYPDKGTGSLVALNYCLLGLGEAGEAQGKLKKVWRGDTSLVEQRDAILDELGDVLWYVTRSCHELGSSLPELMQRNADKLYDRKWRGVIKGAGDNR